MMKNKTIMVCDDDQGILDVLKMLLETEGFTVYTESNSTQVVSGILAHSPDLLLLDLWMPVLPGDQVLKIIRNTDKIKNLPVIVLSASVDGSDISANAGANSFIAKPFDLDDLVLKINNLLMN